MIAVPPEDRLVGAGNDDRREPLGIRQMILLTTAVEQHCVRQHHTETVVRRVLRDQLERREIPTQSRGIPARDHRESQPFPGYGQPLALVADHGLFGGNRDKGYAPGHERQSENGDDRTSEPSING